MSTLIPGPNVELIAPLVLYNIPSVVHNAARKRGAAKGRGEKEGTKRSVGAFKVIGVALPCKEGKKGKGENNKGKLGKDR